MKPALQSRFGDRVLVDGQPVDYSALPDKLRDGMRRYIEEGILPGDFLKAAISNDLCRAVALADPESFLMLPDLCKWFYNSTPPSSWGTGKAMLLWSQERRHVMTRIMARTDRPAVS